jgi:hypothetical protein
MAGELIVTEKTLWEITDSLQMFSETLDSIDAALSTTLPDDERMEARANRLAVQKRIEEIGAQLVTKTDALAAVIRRIASEQELVKTEEQRLHARRKAFERAEAWLKKYVVSVMQERGITQLKTPQNTLFLRTTEAVVITDQAVLPAQYQNAEIKMPLFLWRQLEALADDYANQEMQRDMKGVRVEWKPVLSAIKPVIKGGEEVPGADLKWNVGLGMK